MAVITKHGIRPQERKPWTSIFRCDSCGCNFTAEFGKDNPRYKTAQGWQRDDDAWWELPCPESFCGGTGKAYK